MSTDDGHDGAHDDGYFGEDVAGRYDASEGDEFDPGVVRRTVDFLADQAGGGRALELAIGTGRIAVPLAERGVPVAGIDMSRAMVARLRAKPGGRDIPVTIGDIATTTADANAAAKGNTDGNGNANGEGDGGGYALAYLVFNTVMNLATQESQVACFRNAAAHLRPGGRFVVEVMVPELRKIPHGQNVVPFHTGPDGCSYTVYDTVTQDATCHYVTVTEDGRGQVTSTPFRYVWPAELDLMARLAGMRLRERWADWSREPFTQDSARHVSVWEKEAA
ncbi:methyltransferase domain-containing protein [Streptomyces sp. CBMA29]|uniref:methyltransferase domain-containing protein n=1 Tax=Streptomyces sp. CBMA29 TaxID=1896314 RepID=UPI001661A5CA|nr:class I SAM-dependent methyltransferase [Streptomyces sp. CBMA29]MBD0739544.1 methyltransferase [Streptomyces sp. CBMA29]